MGIEISGMVMMQISGKILEREYFALFFYLADYTDCADRFACWVLDVGSLLSGKFFNCFKLHFL